MENGNFAAAIECLSEAISINPHNSNIFLARASCYKSIQMFAEAYFDYSFLIKLEPLNGKNYSVCLCDQLYAVLKHLEYNNQVMCSYF